MSKFSASGVSGAITTTLKSALGLRQPAASPTSYLRIYSVVLSSAATPGDVAIEWVCQRYSTAGTSTAVTPTDIEDLGQTPTGLVGQTFTAEPTVVSNTVLFDQSVNQRATYTLILPYTFEWLVGTTTNRQITAAAKAGAGTPTALATFSWHE